MSLELLSLELGWGTSLFPLQASGASAMHLLAGLVFVCGGQLILLELELLQHRASSERFDPACQLVVIQAERQQRRAASEWLESARQLIVVQAERMQCRAAPERLEGACELVVGQAELPQSRATLQRLEAARQVGAANQVELLQRWQPQLGQRPPQPAAP
eukprot:scaffold43820_cov33-Phaeocystis_antarctica.AAC.2